MVVLMAAVLALPGAANSAMWVGGELGANFVSNADLHVGVPGLGSVTFKSVRFDPSAMGGVTIGYDFVNTGFGAYNWPDWMKYFSFATDFTYNRFDAPNQFVSVSAGPLSGNAFFPLGANPNAVGVGRVEGYMAAWTFLFMGHYGFLPDSEVPGGRLNPYVGVGPCVLFSGLDVPGLGSASSTNIALVTEAGIRYMALKNVSLDLSFRYRYASPSYDFDIPVAPGFRSTTSTVSLDAHQFSILTRVSYHF